MASQIRPMPSLTWGRRISLVIRDYEEGDWPHARRVHDLARPIELEGSCDPRAFVPLADDAADLDEFQQCQKLVACIDGRVVGFVGVDHDEVGWLYVDPADTGKGIGRRLLRAGLSRIEARVSVHVLSGNARALSLYESEGFTIVNTFRSDNNGYAWTVLKLSQPR